MSATWTPFEIAVPIVEKFMNYHGRYSPNIRQMKHPAISNGVEKVFAIVLGVSFGLIALFGFSVASAGVHGGCVADAYETLQGSACPVSGSPFILLASHLASLHEFVGSFGGGFLALLLALALIAWVAFFAAAAPPFLPSFSPLRLSASSSRAALKRIRWTALHESSPTCRL